MCSTNGLRACFRKTEVLYLAFLDQFLHRSRNVFDRRVRIDTVLVVRSMASTLSRLSEPSTACLMGSGLLFKVVPHRWGPVPSQTLWRSSLARGTQRGLLP